MTQEGCLDGQVHDDDINEDIGDNDRDVVLSAQKHEAEILAERNNRRRARSEIKRDLNKGDDDSSSSEGSVWRPSQDGDDLEDEDDFSFNENGDEGEGDDSDDTIPLVQLSKRKYRTGIVD